MFADVAVTRGPAVPRVWLLYADPGDAGVEYCGGAVGDGEFVVLGGDATPVGEAADNVLNRQFKAEAKRTKWVTDVTEFNTGTTKVYLSPVLDLHNNRVISATAGASARR